MMKRSVSNSGDWDCTYWNYYDDQWRLIEERNGSEVAIRQYIYGQRYVDEIVGITVLA
jgi:hypothetical protein